MPPFESQEFDLPSAAMPNCVRCCVPAGWAVLFDTASYHVALPNTSQRDRVGTIAGFSVDAPPMQIPQHHIEALCHEGTWTARRKAAFGLELTAEEAAEVAPAREAAARWIRRQTGGYSN